MRVHTIIRSLVVSCVRGQHWYREAPCAWDRTEGLQSPHSGVLLGESHIGHVKSGCVVPLPKAWLEAGLPSFGEVRHV